MGLVEKGVRTTPAMCEFGDGGRLYTISNTPAAA
jgi:hypothetical protein